MIILTIGDTSRRLTADAGIEESWVTLHMRAAGGDSAQPGVHIRITSQALALSLSAGESVQVAMNGRAPRPEESRVVDLWRERGMDRPDFRSGQLVSFLHQLHDVLEQEPMHTTAAAV